MCVCVCVGGWVTRSSGSPKMIPPACVGKQTSGRGPMAEFLGFPFSCIWRE